MASEVVTMRYSARLGCGVLGVGLAIGGCDSCSCDSVDTGAPESSAAGSSAPAGPRMSPQELLSAALQAAGGADKLKGASSFRAKYQSASATGHQEQGQFVYRPGASRLRVATSGGLEYSLYSGQEGCAWFYDPVVLKCEKDRSLRASRYHVAYEASWLWPLAGEGWTLESGSRRVAGEPHDTLRARKRGTEFDTTLFFDADSHLLTRLSVPFGRDGTSVPRVAVRSEFSEVCGAKVALQEEAFIEQRKQFTVKLSDVRCETVPDQEVTIPQQVADRAVLERKTGGGTLLCNTETVPYAKVLEHFGALEKYAEKRGLRRQREIAHVLFASAPKPGEPPPDVAGGCFEIAGKAPAEPERDGPYELRADPPRRVLSAFGIGRYDDQVAKLIEVLDAEVDKRSLTPAPSGPVRQLGYMIPEGAPPTDHISEMQIELTAGAE